MNKIVYSFWTAPLKRRWVQYQKDYNLEDMLQSSINCLYLSVLYAKKWGFEVEIVTDLDSAHYFKKLPVDAISDDLTFLDYNGTWTKGKMLAIAKQTKPFVHMDWDVMLTKKAVVKMIQECKTDVLIQGIDTIIHDKENIKGNQTYFRDLYYLKVLIDYKPNLIEEFETSHEYMCNSAIVGFNDMKIKDKYVSNFLKCIEVSNSISWLDASRAIDQFTLYCTVNSCKGSMTKILPDKGSIQETAKEIGYVHFTFLSKYTKSIQEKIKDKICNEFSSYSHLIKPKPAIKNEVKISLCTVVMDRFDHMVTTLKHNLEIVRRFKGEIDINILDYNSKDGLEAYLFRQIWFLKGVADGLIHYYRNYTAKHYHRTLPKNAIHNLASGEYLINIDADNYISRSYLTFCLTTTKHEKNFFIRPAMGCAKGAIGRIMIHRDDFRRLGGYNLKIINYGFEDTEITLRLRKLGIRQLCIPVFYWDTIDHKDELRYINEKPRKKLRFDHPLEDSDYENKKIEFELYPNSNQIIDVELFYINHKREKTKIYDTSTHIMDRAI